MLAMLKMSPSLLVRVMNVGRAEPDCISGAEKVDADEHLRSSVTCAWPSIKNALHCYTAIISLLLKKKPSPDIGEMPLKAQREGLKAILERVGRCRMTARAPSQQLLSPLASSRPPHLLCLHFHLTCAASLPQTTPQSSIWNLNEL
jgi:hypothetical protein